MFFRKIFEAFSYKDGKSSFFKIIAMWFFHDKQFYKLSL